jgi:hypothetical protein
MLGAAVTGAMTAVRRSSGGDCGRTVLTASVGAVSSLSGAR